MEPSSGLAMLGPAATANGPQDRNQDHRAEKATRMLVTLIPFTASGMCKNVAARKPPMTAPTMPTMISPMRP